MELFTLKKILGAILMPLPLIFLLFLIGLCALWLGRKTLANILLVSVLSMLILVSTPFATDPLLRDLEHQYRQYDIGQPVSRVVVLGCGHTNDGQVPLTSQLHDCSISRSIEAMLIHRANPGSRIITSGSGFNEPFTNAEMNRRLLIALGVNEADIISVPQPKDTEEEALLIAPLLIGKPFALVTSASHMSRAMSLFEAQNLVANAAPTEHLVRYGTENKWWNRLPKSRNIKKAERWWYEYLGQTWLQIKAMF